MAHCTLSRSLDLQLYIIISNLLCFCLRVFFLESEEKLSRNQLMEIRFNRCILLLHMGKTEDTLKALDELDGM